MENYSFDCDSKQTHTKREREEEYMDATRPWDIDQSDVCWLLAKTVEKSSVFSMIGLFLCLAQLRATIALRTFSNVVGIWNAI